MTAIAKIENGAATRSILPQIPKKELSAYVNYLKDNGIDVSAKYIGVQHLKPVQKEYNKQKVEELKQKENEIKNLPFIVSKENYIMDGHHRWVAFSELDEKYPVRIIQVQLPLTELIKYSRKYSGSSAKTVKEEKIKLRRLLPEQVNELSLTEAIRTVDKQIEDLKQKKQQLVELRVPVNKLIRKADRLTTISNRQMKNKKWKIFEEEVKKDIQLIEKKLQELGLVNKFDHLDWSLLKVK